MGCKIHGPNLLMGWQTLNYGNMVNEPKMKCVYERWMLKIHFLCSNFPSSLPSTSIGYLFAFHIITLCTYSHFILNKSLSPTHCIFRMLEMRARISHAITESTLTSVDWETLFTVSFCHISCCLPFSLCVCVCVCLIIHTLPLVRRDQPVYIFNDPKYCLTLSFCPTSKRLLTLNLNQNWYHLWLTACCCCCFVCILGARAKWALPWLWL